jgi:hypothetical protein
MPNVNFAISAHSNQSTGLQHLGIQVDSQEELQDVYQNMENAEGQILNEGHTTCCYAKSEKSWIADPQNVSWEVFRTYGDSTVYSKNIVAAAPETMEKWEGNDMKIAEAKPAFELQTCCAPTCCN